ncbi:MAG: signal peptide peptidase SppA [Thermodesulfobacteriota bacterium]|nr:MAG: signal peptide peptidase SppA [Thermodesulfobacteriota bacterium]
MQELRTRKERRYTHPLLVALATIGVFTVLITVAFFLLILWTTRGGITSPSIYHGDKIGVVDIKGLISEPEATIKALRDFRYNQKIKAVVIRINSPGGAVGASQELYEEIQRLDQKKPVVASLATVAASGGYYASLGARHIVANPGTVTASIGVIMKVPNIEGLLEKLGIKTTVVKSGTFKDLGSITRDMTEDERALLKGVMQDIQKQFVTAVAKSRKLPKEQVSAIADGRIMTGHQALDAKLVDQLGNFSVAVDKAAGLAGIEGRPELVYPKKDRISIMRELLQEEGTKTLGNALRQLLGSSAGSPVSYGI